MQFDSIAYWWCIYITDGGHRYELALSVCSSANKYNFVPILSTWFHKIFNVSCASITCMHVGVIYMLVNSAKIWTSFTLPGKAILSTNMSLRGILRLTYSSSECRISEAWFKQVLCSTLTCRSDRMTSTYVKCCVYQQVFISGHTLVWRGFRSSPDWGDIIYSTYYST